MPVIFDGLRIDQRSRKMGDYDMYTSDGNDAVTIALSIIDRLAMNRLQVWNKETLTDAARPLLQEVAKIYSEVYDTEPRGLIADHLDGICKMNGWHYNDFEGYDW